MQHHGLGYQGGFIDFLIIEGPTWEDDTWGERGTSINLTRHDAKWFSAKRRGYTDILLGCVCSKWRLARGRTTAKEVTSMNEGMPNDVEIASEADSNHNQVPSPDHSQHPSHSAPHPHGVELVLCPHLEPLEECLHCSVSYPDCSIAATSLDHGIYTDESDDTSSAASDAIFSSKYTSFFPTCGTINHAHVVDDCNLDDLSNDELSDDGVLPLPKVTLDDDGLAIWEDGQLFETSSEISCDDDLGLAEKRLNSSYAQESLHQVRHEAPHSGSTSIASFTPLTNSLGVSTGKHVAVQYGVAAPVGVTVNNGATGSGEIVRTSELCFPFQVLKCASYSISNRTNYHPKLNSSVTPSTQGMNFVSLWLAIFRRFHSLLRDLVRMPSWDFSLLSSLRYVTNIISFHIR